MAYVVDKATGEVVDGCDTWDLLDIDNMVMDAKASGYGNVSYEITEFGNMIIWVE